VRQLTAQTAQATSRIGLQVTSIQSATGEAVEAVRGVTLAIDQVNGVAAAIAAAVEEQSAATRAIAGQVQSVSRVTDAATQAMREVCSAAERSGAASRGVAEDAGSVAGQATMLREEVDHFLEAMRSSQASGERRRYERIPGRNAPARLQCGTHGSALASITDISLGGAKLACDWPCDVGAPLLVGLPGEGEPALARVVDSRNGALAVAFRQDAGTLARVGAALEAIGDVSDERAARAA
jgi:methyl-accepting chemotaxis protein